jgi:hypothetical protein
MRPVSNRISEDKNPYLGALKLPSSESQSAAAITNARLFPSAFLRYDALNQLATI